MDTYILSLRLQSLTSSTPWRSSIFKLMHTSTVRSVFHISLPTFSISVQSSHQIPSIVRDDRPFSQYFSVNTYHLASSVSHLPTLCSPFPYHPSTHFVIVSVDKFLLLDTLFGPTTSSSLSKPIHSRPIPNLDSFFCFHRSVPATRPSLTEDI